MLADGGAQFVSAADIGFDTGGFGGTRCTRMSMLVNDGKVEQVFMEEGGGELGWMERTCHCEVLPARR
eukprot:scaffold377_cov269-Pinguiococcus_pyrenoidosus.AAC.3